MISFSRYLFCRKYRELKKCEHQSKRVVLFLALTEEYSNLKTSLFSRGKSQICAIYQMCLNGALAEPGTLEGPQT